MTDFVIPIGIVVLVVAVLISLVIMAIGFFRNKDKAGSFNIKTLLKIYLYFTCLVTLFIASTGAILFIKASFSKLVSYQFSYQVMDVYTDLAPVKDGDSVPVQDTTRNPYGPGYTNIEIDGVKYSIDNNRVKKDFINGATLAISLLILFGIHKFSILSIEKGELNTSSFRKAYLFISLILYSILGIISIPAAIYESANYFLTDWSNFGYDRSVPGDPIAVALVVTPLWIIFLLQVIKLHKNEGKTGESK